ncbi:MAG: cupin domain-containing protein [Oscillochloridaceae bacterium umkhey_bin13]
MAQQFEQSRQILVTSTETNGAFGLIACTLPPFCPSQELRRHAHQLAGCYVLTGLVALTRDEATITLAAGDFALIRPGEAHRYWNPSPSPAQLLLFFAPGGAADEP